ncbi:hypothetical protein YC2023_092911 [Brassica napus]
MKLVNVCMSVDKFVALLLWRRVTFTSLFETLQVASWAASKAVQYGKTEPDNLRSSSYSTFRT